MKLSALVSVLAVSKVATAVSIPRLRHLAMATLMKVRKACISSELSDSCIELEADVPVVNTLDEARLMNRVYKGQVRVEKLNGTFAMIDHEKSLHIGTVGGAALDKLASNVEGIEKRRLGSCQPNSCVIVASCGRHCSFCYPAWCQ